ncbi:MULTISPECIES: hypothetical protein [unclassified Variovorax]|uniref:hypothetical protein n=1 Tax=unclassified Variovorax TaxID=663243 RepID=UPI001317E5CE|nr:MULTISPECIES: hypothetical protein [unclassified Variovorax]VTU42498.1 hypothetical protein H6P1_00206 [Variovorax sp. PBL-H6]VTU43889.1 hypothetical protein SRS16P1_00696 [Variovorax sp. SRS16]VTU43962.1 hypothetical protein E5P1_00689 [Variovorax sp. PBL-E5]
MPSEQPRPVRPELAPAFQPGQVIEFCDDFFVVRDNLGASGTVTHLDGQHCSSNWRWSFEDEVCRLATEAELKALDTGLPLVSAALARLKAAS